MAAPTKPLLPVPGMTPAMASNPSASVDPFAAFPDAQAALSTTALLPPFELNARPTPTKEPQADAFADYPDAPAPAAPEADFSAYPDVKETRGYDIAKLKAADATTLAKDKAEFNPVEFYAQHKKDLLNDSEALKKVEDVYAEREKEQMTVGDIAKGILTAPLHPIETGKTAVKAVKGGAQVIGQLLGGVGQVAATAGQAAGALSAGDFKGAAGHLADTISAFDAAQQRWVTTVTDKIAPGLGLLSKGKTARERLAFDADFKEKELAAGAGNGELARALGTDQEGLKASGVTLHPEAIEKLSTIEDPIFLVPIGGAIGVVSRGGKFLLGAAINEAAAEGFAQLGNALIERAVTGTGTKLAELTGKALEKIGGVGEVGFGKIADTLPGLHLGLLKAVPRVAEWASEGVSLAGKGIEAAAPYVGVVGTEALKGAAEASALALPLFIGSTPEERDSLLGLIGAGGLIRGGGAAVGLGANVAGRAAQEKLAKTIFESVDRGPVKDSPYYGTDQSLDKAHAEHEANLNPGERSAVSWTREFFRPFGVEVYSLDKNSFTNHVPQVGGAGAAEGYYLTRGERVSPDGTRTPVIQILLNGDTNGLGHELYHAFKSLDPNGAEALESQISKTWHPAEQQWLSDQYNSALNGGKPRSEWEVELSKNQILEEAAAEVFGRVFNATDLSGVVPSVTKRAALFASTVLEKMGYPLAGKGLKAGPGVSALGIRPGTAERKVAQDFLTDLAKRAKRGETFSKPAKQPAIAGGIEPGAVSRRSAPAGRPTPPEIIPTPAAPKPATPAPRPAPAPTGPKAPNIRVTPKEQLDYAAQRSKVTNATPALEGAKKLEDPQAKAHVEAINASMEAGHGVEIVHKGVIREGGPTPEEPVGRGTRRAEQEEAYIKEAMGAVPEDIRERHQKVLFGTRWQRTGKSGWQLTARSLDKGLANIKNAVEMMTATGEPMPYEVGPGGKALTDAGWEEVVQDLKDYWGNQDRGFRGDGEKFVRPTEDIGVSLPPEDPRGPVAKISTERLDFLNLIQGLNIPEAVTRQLPGKIPGNVKGQLLAELQGKTPQKPTAIRPEDIGRQAYKPIEGVPGVREIAEVNPLRNRLRRYGQPVGKLIEVTENVNLKNIESVTPRPDVPGRGGVTDITRAGFSVKAPEPSQEVRGIAERAAKAAGVADYKPSTTYAPLNTDLMKRLADFYESAKSAPTDPAVKSSYEALISQTEAQGKAILDAGYTIEPFTGTGEPYKSSAEMLADVRDNKHLFFLQTEKAFGRGGEAPPENPMLKPSTLVPGQLANDVFRWVHDFFGHAKEGYQFGPRGEFNAWKSHSEMFTPEAQGALAAETLAQNSWVNFGKHLRSGAGTIPAKGEAGYVAPAARPFGEQKNIVVPADLIQAAKNQSTTQGKFSLTAPEFGTELEKIAKGESEGQTFNLDGTVFNPGDRKLDVVTLASQDHEAAAITPEKVQAFIDTYPDVAKMPDSKAGIFRLEKKPSKVSADMNVVVDQTHRANTEAFARANNQESFFDLVKFEVVPSGGTGETILKDPKTVAHAAERLVRGMPVDVKEFEGKFSASANFTDELDPIKSAAIRTTGGHVVTGSWHGEALDNLAQQVGRGEFTEKIPEGIKEIYDLYDKGFLTDGFVTHSGKFLDREQALEHARKIGQLKKDREGLHAREGHLESDEFRGSRSFSVKGEERTPDALLHTTIAGLKAAPGYAEAKAGDARKALDVARLLVRTEKFDDLAKKYPNAKVVAVRAEEQAGKNAIPWAAGRVLADAHGWGWEDGIVQKNTVYHTGASNVERLERTPQFDGPVTKGQDYVILDDVSTSGSTLGALATYIRDNGGNVVGATALAGAFRPGRGHGAHLSLRPDTEKALRAVDKDKLAATLEKYGISKLSDLADPQGRIILRELERGPARPVAGGSKGTPGALPGVGPAISGGPVRRIGLEDIKPTEGSFSARPKRETEKQAQKRIEETDYSKYNIPEKAQEMKTSGTGWIFPDKEFVPLNQAYHEQFLADNSEQLNERFGTKFTTESDVEQRLDAVNKGFVRARYQPANGRFNIEAGAGHWTPATKKSIFDLLEKHADNLDHLNVSIVDKKGQAVDSTSQRLFDLEGKEKMAAVKDALDGLKATATPGNKGPSNIARARELGGGFSVKKGASFGNELPGFEHATGDLHETVTRAHVAAQAREHPEALPVQYSRDKETGKLNISSQDGKPITKKVDYDLANTPMAEKVGAGLEGKAREDAISEAYADGLEKLYNKEAKDNPDIMAGVKWYSTARSRIKKLFGADTKLFCELLGATSAQTPVDVNYRTALDAYNLFKQGAYDGQIKKYREGKAAWESGDLSDFVKDTGNEKPKRTQFLEWWVDKHNLKPKKSNNTLFGANSKHVLRVFDGSWEEEAGGPKTPNFAGNLKGTTFEATIDVWASRTMHRLGNEGAKGPWRILPESETGISDSDFYLSQAAFKKAAKRIGIKPDALQAIVWFAEKDRWAKNGWTSSEGAEKSDFNMHLAESERLPSGKIRKKQPQLGLDLSAEEIKKK